MIVNVKSRQEINSIIDDKFGKNSFLEVEISAEGIIIKKYDDLETIKTVAESDEFSGY